MAGLVTVVCAGFLTVTVLAFEKPWTASKFMDAVVSSSALTSWAKLPTSGTFGAKLVPTTAALNKPISNFFFKPLTILDILLIRVVINCWLLVVVMETILLNKTELLFKKKSKIRYYPREINSKIIALI